MMRNSIQSLINEIILSISSSNTSQSFLCFTFCYWVASRRDDLMEENTILSSKSGSSPSLLNLQTTPILHASRIFSIEFKKVKINNFQLHVKMNPILKFIKFAVYNCILYKGPPIYFYKDKLVVFDSKVLFYKGVRIDVDD